jgi:hypothetical protein
MQKLFRCVLVPLVLAASASIAAAGELKLTLSNGRATLIAQDVPLRQILDEWARVGKTTIVNGEKLSGPAITVELVDRPEAEVLELLLRSASGYIAAPRDAAAPAGASVFARVMILPVSRGPVGIAAAPPPAFGMRPNPGPQPMPMPVPDDDDAEPPAQVAPPPGMGTVPGAPNPFPGPQPVQQPVNGQQQPVLTAPRPGMLPAPPAAQPNPYGAPVVQPGVVRPGGPGGPGGLEPND